MEAQYEAPKLFEEGLLFPAKKEGRAFEMTAVPNGTDALGASNDDDDDFESSDDDEEEEEEDLVAMIEELCRITGGTVYQNY